MYIKIQNLLKNIQNLQWESDVDRQYFIDFLAQYEELEGTDRQPKHALNFEKISKWRNFKMIRHLIHKNSLSFKLDDEFRLTLINHDPKEEMELNKHIMIMGNRIN